MGYRALKCLKSSIIEVRSRMPEISVNQKASSQNPEVRRKAIKLNFM
jgi:hypothetical protein